MSISVAAAERRFVYNGTVLADPAPGLSVEQVRDAHAAMYPEIATATIEGPTEKDGVLEYSYKRKVGTKG